MKKMAAIALALCLALSGGALAEGSMDAEGLRTAWETERGLPYAFWPMEDLVAFDAACGADFPRHVMPADTDLSAEEAVRLARQAVMETYRIYFAGLVDNYEGAVSAASLVEEEANVRQWRVLFGTVVSPTQPSITFEVVLDASGGLIACADHR